MKQFKLIHSFARHLSIWGRSPIEKGEEAEGVFFFWGLAKKGRPIFFSLFRSTIASVRLRIFTCVFVWWTGTMVRFLHRQIPSPSEGFKAPHPPAKTKW